MDRVPGFVSAPMFVTRQPNYLTSVKPHRLFSISIRRRPASYGRPIIASSEPMVLSEGNVNIALEEVKTKLGSMFGNSVENRDVGITGDVECASVDGPVVVLRLKGRFWHKRADVLARVSMYLMERIPEICDTEVEDIRQLEDSEEESARLSL